MKTKIFLLIFLIITAQAVYAQIMFQRHYGGTADDYGCRVLQTDDGGYLVAAITESYGEGYRDIFLVRTNEFGDTLWTKTIGGTGGEQPNALKVTNDNNFIIVGSTSSYGEGGYDVYFLKLNQNGDIIWAKTYGGILDEDGCDVIQTIDEGYLVVGTTMSYATGFSSMYIIKTDSVGDTLWTKTYEEKSANTGISVIQLIDGGYFIVGQTLLPGQMSTSDCYFVRTNVSGDTIWTKTFGGADYDGAFEINKVAGGNIIISGTTKSYGQGGYDIFLSMVNTSGDEIWMKTYGGVDDDYGGMFSPSNDGGYIITGYTKSFGAGNQDMYLIKTNNSGDTLWTKTFGGNDNEWGGSVKQTSDNGFVVVGNTNSYGNGYDVYFVKTNSAGISGFARIINENIECKVFPNPCFGFLNIESNITDNTDFNIDVYDISGKRMFEKKVSTDESNMYSLDLTGLREGFYILQLCFENKCVTKKLLIQK